MKVLLIILPKLSLIESRQKAKEIEKVVNAVAAVTLATLEMEI